MSDFGPLCDVLCPEFCFSDERGMICQLVHDGFKQVNVVFSEKGARRGGLHYHELNEELFYVISGSVRVRLKLLEREEEHVFGAGDMFQIHKEVRHDFLFLEDTLLVGMYDKGVEISDNVKDICTDEQAFSLDSE